MAANGKLRIHIENMSAQNRVFHLDHERIAHAAARHPDIAPHVEFTMGFDQENYAEAMRRADGLVGWRFPRERLNEDAPHLKWIHLTGAGLEHLMPLDWLPGGIGLTNNRGVHARKAGEFAAMAILMINSQIPALMTSQRNRAWDKIFTPSIAGRTLLIIGVGNMGGAAARMAKLLGMTVIGVRRTGKPHRYVDEMHRTEDLPRLLPRADIVLVSAPLTDATRHLLGRAELDLLPKGAGLVNIGRADIVDYEALAEKLSSGDLSGAVLDVFNPEPLPTDSQLWDTPRLMITPHCSSDAVEDYSAGTLDLVFENAARLLQGRPLKNRVRPAIGY